jgi:hypothetical protein
MNFCRMANACLLFRGCRVAASPRGPLTRGREGGGLSWLLSMRDADIVFNVTGH